MSVIVSMRSSSTDLSESPSWCTKDLDFEEESSKNKEKGFLIDTDLSMHAPIHRYMIEREFLGEMSGRKKDEKKGESL